MPEPAYQRIANELRTRISDGTYPAGHRLPSLRELGDEYGVSHMVSRAVYNVLTTEGLVEGRFGSGYYVRETPRIKRTRRIPGGGSGDSTFATEMRRLGLEPRTELVRVAVEPAADEIAGLLQLNEDAQVLVRERHMFGSDLLVQLAWSYIPLEVAGGEEFAHPDVGPTGMYQRLTERGFRPVRATEAVGTRRPTSEETHLLGVPEGQNVLTILRTVWDEQDRPIEVSPNVLPGEQWEAVYEWAL